MLEVHEAAAPPVSEVVARDSIGGGAPPISERSLWQGLKRGLARVCPACGEGRLFRSYLKIEETCPVCGADNGRFPSDDAPPYVTIFLVGHITVPPILWIVSASTVPIWLIFAVSIPLLIILSIVMLPFVKGAVVGLLWAWDIVRGEIKQSETEIAVSAAMQGGERGAILTEKTPEAS